MSDQHFESWQEYLYQDKLSWDSLDWIKKDPNKERAEAQLKAITLESRNVEGKIVSALGILADSTGEGTKISSDYYL